MSSFHQRSLANVTFVYSLLNLQEHCEKKKASVLLDPSTLSPHTQSSSFFPTLPIVWTSKLDDNNVGALSENPCIRLNIEIYFKHF